MKLEQKLQALQNRLDRYISKAVKATKSMILDLIFAIAKLERMIEVIKVKELTEMLPSKGKGLRFFHKGNFSQIIIDYCQDKQIVEFVRQLYFAYKTGRLEQETIQLIEKGTALQICKFLVKYKMFCEDRYEQTFINIKHLGLHNI